MTHHACRALLIALSVFAASCSSPPGVGEDTATSNPRPSASEPTLSTSKSPASTASTVSTGDQTRSMSRSELLESWATDRSAAVDRIVSAGWGVAGSVLLGPGGLEVDLGACPSSWSDSGPESDTVRLAWWSGVQHGPDMAAAAAYLDWLGDDATVGGRRIELVAGEWPLGAPEMHAGVVSEMSDAALAAVGFHSWQGNLDEQDLFAQTCLPALATGSEHDRVLTPWFTPSVQGLPREVEAKIWVDDALTRFDGQEVAMLVTDRPWGQTFADAFAASGTEVVVSTHSSTAVEIDAAVASLVEADPAAIYLATFPTYCHSALQRIRSTSPEVPIIVPMECAVLNFLQPGQGEQALYTIAGVFSSEVEDVNQVVFEPSLDPTLMWFGWTDYHRRFLSIWQAVETLKIAGELDGGLTRSNILLAAWSFRGQHPFAEGPIAVTWPDDVFAIDQARLLSYNSTQAAWTLTSDVYGP